jgi:integral membrane protein
MSEAGERPAVAERPGPLGGTRGALKRYQVMAFVVGIGLAILCFVGVPMQVVGNFKWPWTAVVTVVGPLHGAAYIVYLLTCLDLAGRARFKALQLLGMVCAGFLPLLAFYMERRVSARVNGLLALGRQAPPGPAQVLWGAVSGRRGGQ